MLSDEQKQKEEWTIDDICEACNFKRGTYHNQRKANKIPQPSDIKFGGYIWKRQTILPFIEEWIATHPRPVTNQPNQP